MKKAILLTALVLGLCSMLFMPKAQTSPITSETLKKMPLAFTKNMGQWDDRVLFRANSGGATMWFTKEGVTYQFTRHVGSRGSAVSTPGIGQKRCCFVIIETNTKGNEKALDNSRAF